MGIKLTERTAWRAGESYHHVRPRHMPGALGLRGFRVPGAPLLMGKVNKGRADKPRVVVVDSEPVAALLENILADECEVTSVASLTTILDQASNPDVRPDLVLLDATRLCERGLELCRRLKGEDATASIPVVVIVDGDNAENEALALRLGADDCLVRPFRLDVVKARILKEIRLKHKTDLLERYANQDSLTEVANRRCFDLTLDAEWRRAVRDGQRLALLMIDVDHFKQFNDLYGHREGDHCLRRVARALAATLTRPGDFLARYGGEEFAAILPATDLAGAFWMGERLRDAVAELAIPHKRSENAAYVTISVGCASMFPGSGVSCYTVAQAADEQLYVAKHAGRNCVR